MMLLFVCVSDKLFSKRFTSTFKSAHSCTNFVFSVFSFLFSFFKRVMFSFSSVWIFCFSILYTLSSSSTFASRFDTIVLYCSISSLLSLFWYSSSCACKCASLALYSFVIRCISSSFCFNCDLSSLIIISFELP